MQSQIDPQLPEETSGPNIGKVLISRLRQALGIARDESTAHGTAIEGLQEAVENLSEDTNTSLTALDNSIPGKVRSAVLTGISFATNAAITAADTVLGALGKLQKQFTEHFADPKGHLTKAQIDNGAIGVVGEDKTGNLVMADGGKLAKNIFGSIEARKSFPFISAAVASTFTFLTEVEASSNILAFRFLLLNGSASPAVWASHKYALAPALGNDGTGLTWANVTFDSAATSNYGSIPLLNGGSTLNVTVPAASGGGADNVFGEAWSDWINTDGSSAVLQIRGLITTSGVSGQIEPTSHTAYDTLASKKWKTAIRSGDQVTNPTGTSMVASAASGWAGAIAIEFLLSENTKKIIVFGDSTNQGQITSPNNFAGWPMYYENLQRIKQNNLSVFNHARAGQTSEQSWLWAKEVLPASGYDYALFKAWSPNDDAPSSVNPYLQRLSAFINICRQNDIIPIVMSSLPWQSLNATSDSIRLNIDEKSKKLCMTNGGLFFDANSVISNFATPQRIKPEFNQDGIHLNALGHQALGAAFDDFIG